MIEEIIVLYIIIYIFYSIIGTMVSYHTVSYPEWVESLFRYKVKKMTINNKNTRYILYRKLFLMPKYIKMDLRKYDKLEDAIFRLREYEAKSKRDIETKWLSKDEMMIEEL